MLVEALRRSPQPVEAALKTPHDVRLAEAERRHHVLLVVIHRRIEKCGTDVREPERPIPVGRQRQQ
eukprot:5210899-Heterocapsa_arctica.AAC.1